MINRVKRRILISYPQMQLKIITFFIFMALVYAAANYYVATHAVQVLFRDISALELSNQTRHDLNIVVQRQERVLELQLAVFTFLGIMMLTLAALVISHRAGGPIYHLRQYLKGLIEGTVLPRHICFRKDDFFGELADVFNRYQEKQGMITPAAETPGSDSPRAE